MRLHFREWPREGAPALVLIHAWPSTVLVWSRFAIAMQDRFRVIALDLRGHGDSDWAADYSWRTVMDDLEAFLRDRDASPASLVGHGGGGIVALCFAATRPSAVRRVINVDQMPMPRGVGSAMQLFHEAFDDPDEPARILAEKHWADRGDPELLRAAMRAAIKPSEGRWTWRRDPRVADAYRERTLIPDEDESLALFATIACPTLLVRGAQTFGPRERYDRVSEVIPDARIAEVPDSRHLPHLSNPDGFLAAVRPFLLAD